MMTERHQTAPAAERNKEPILAVLKRVLPPTGFAVEIASGTGQHVAHFAAALRGWTWQPTEIDAQMHESIKGWLAETGVGNVKPPLTLDVCGHCWPVDRADAVLCINMIHIAPWQATEGLLAGCGRLLGQGGLLYLYGPYRRFGRHTAPSNEAFDASLRERDPQWGVRDLETVVETAELRGFSLSEVVEMPANNLSVVFARN